MSVQDAKSDKDSPAKVAEFIIRSIEEGRHEDLVKAGYTVRIG